MINKTLGSQADFEITGTELVTLIQNVLSCGKVFRFKASGSSMSPFIRSGDILQISPLPNTKPTLGQVVAYKYPQTEGLIVHRFVGRNTAGWLFHGDDYAAHNFDLVPDENLLGLVTLIDHAGVPSCFGLRFERIPIAMDSRYNLLFPIIQIARKIKRVIQKQTT